MLPLTHFNRLVRGILLKGDGLAGPLARTVADDGVHGGRDVGRRARLPPHPGLNLGACSDALPSAAPLSHARVGEGAICRAALDRPSPAEGGAGRG